MMKTGLIAAMAAVAGKFAGRAGVEVRTVESGDMARALVRNSFGLFKGRISSIRLTLGNDALLVETARIEAQRHAQEVGRGQYD